MSDLNQCLPKIMVITVLFFFQLRSCLDVTTLCVCLRISSKAKRNLFMKRFFGVFFGCAHSQRKYDTPWNVTDDLNSTQWKCISIQQAIKWETKYVHNYVWVCVCMHIPPSCIHAHTTKLYPFEFKPNTYTYTHPPFFLFV